MVPTLIIVLFSYLIIALVHYRSLIITERNNVISLQIAIEEAEILIKKYQIQLQKNIGIVNSYEKDIEYVKTELKNNKERLAVTKRENGLQKATIIKLESKLESIV
jgi:hypothetical protein